MHDADKRLAAHRDRLSADLHNQPAAAYFIPNHDHTQWQELDHDEAMRWLKYNHYQAMSLDHKVFEKAGAHWVYFRVWEFPDDAPDWGDIFQPDPTEKA